MDGKCAALLHRHSPAVFDGETMERSLPAPLMLAALVLAALGLGCCKCAFRDQIDETRSKIQLVARQPSESGLAYPDAVFVRHEIRDSSLVKLAKTASFKQWNTYEDAYLSFSYPANPNIRVEVRADESTFPRAYRLTLGAHSFHFMTLDREPWFYEVFCPCGEAVYYKYTFHCGVLYRFSFRKDGEVGRIQLLCNGQRVAFSEWPHLPMHQDVYVRIGLTVKLKSAPCDQAKLRQRILERYGIEARLGFIEKGMNRQQVIDLLGAPNKESGGGLEYVITRGDLPVRTSYRGKCQGLHGTVAIDFHDGVFMGFDARPQGHQSKKRDAGDGK